MDITKRCPVTTGAYNALLTVTKTKHTQCIKSKSNIQNLFCKMLKNRSGMLRLQYLHRVPSEPHPMANSTFLHKNHAKYVISCVIVLFWDVILL